MGFAPSGEGGLLPAVQGDAVEEAVRAIGRLGAGANSLNQGRLPGRDCVQQTLDLRQGLLRFRDMGLHFLSMGRRNSCPADQAAEQQPVDLFAHPVTPPLQTSPPSERAAVPVPRFAPLHPLA